MRDLIDILAAYESLSTENVPLALATIVAVEGSSYRRPGARMLVAVDGRRFGTVSGGCLEADVARRAQVVIASGKPTLCRYETGDDPDAILYLDDDTAGAEPGVSLGCGGAIEIFIEPISADRPGAMPFIADAIHRNTRSHVGLIYRVGGNVDAEAGTIFRIPDDRADDALPLPFVLTGERDRGRGADLATPVSGPASSRISLASSPLADVASVSGGNHSSKHPEPPSPRRPSPPPSPRVQGEGGSHSDFERHFLPGGWLDVLFEKITPPPHLMILGDGSDALPLIELAKFQGWRTTVAGYRAGAKLPGDRSIHLRDHAEDDLVIDPAAAVVVMTHDLLRDARLLRRLAEAPPMYVGVLGPLHRTRRLLAAAEIDDSIFNGRLFAPIGLDLGGEGPQRVALSIIAEIAAVLGGHAAGHLRDKPAGIHEPDGATTEPVVR